MLKNRSMPIHVMNYLSIFFIAIIIISCRQPQSPPPNDRVTVGLKWVHQAQFAGFYVAQELGYYAEENIEVTFVEGGPGIDVIEQVHLAKADFGITTPENILLYHSQGKPMVAIATTYRRNPYVLVALEASGIRKPQDLPGKTVAIGNIEGRIQVETMLDNIGVDISEITIVPYDFDLTSFYHGEIDVVPAFAAGSLNILKQERDDLALIWPGDYGVHMYSDTIFATESFLAANSDLTTRFLRATLRGHRTAVENPETAVSASLKYAREADPTLQQEMVLASIPLIHTGEDQIGWMRPNLWLEMHDTLVEHHCLPQPIDVQSVYTLEYLINIYGDGS